MNAARIRALAIVSTLLIAAVVLAVYTLNKDTQDKASYTGACAGLIPIVTKPLPDTAQITIKVWNGSKRVGLAQDLADQFQHRGFHVEPKVGDKPALNDIVALYYGPKTVGAAWVLRAYFLDGMNPANLHFDIHRTSTVVDVVIGQRFQQLGAPTEINQSIAALGSPTAPPGTCGNG